MISEFIDSLVVERVPIVVAGILLICLIVRFLYYHAKLRAISQHRNAYGTFLDQASKDSKQFKAFGDIAERQPDIVKLFEEAGQSPHQQAVVQPMGHGLVGTGSANAWTNLHNNDHETVSANLQNFHRTKGFFRARRNETFSPVFWIESFLRWPNILIGFFGFNSEGRTAKLSQVSAIVVEVVATINFVTENLP